MANLARGNPARWWKSRSCGGVSRAPRSLHISPFRRWAGTSALIFFILLFAGFWYITNPARISRLSEALFSRVLGGSVKVRTGRLSLSGTLLLSGVEVRTADPEPAAAGDIPIFSAENVEVRIDWLSLLSGQLSATQLVAETPIFRPIEDRATGHWNYERMHPSGLGGAVKGSPGSTQSITLPVVILRDARVRWGEVKDNRVETTAETVIEGDLTPDATKSSVYRFQFAQLASAGKPAVGAILRGTLDTSTNTFSAVTENVDMSETLKNGLPRIAREWCDEHRLEGRLSRLAITLNEREGLTVSVIFQNVGMMFMVEPEQGIALGEERPSYPVDIRNVAGNVDFHLREHGDPLIQFKNITGEVLKYQFVADCEMHGANFDYPFKLKLRFPDAVLGDRYPPLFMAFLTSQDLLARVAPHGHMDISLDMNRDALRAPMNIDGIVDCHDAVMRYAFFPFPMDHINGRITFDRDSCTFHDVKAKADMNDVVVTGTTGTNWAHRFIDFTVMSNNVNFDDRLAAAMPDKYREIWDLFEIQAHGGFVCRVTRSNNVLDLPKVVVDVHIEDGKGFVRAMPFQFKGASGDLHFEADETRIDHLTAITGMDGSGHVALDGKVYHPSGDVQNLRPELRIKADLPIDDAFLHGLPEDVTDKLKDMTAGGRLGFDGWLRRAANALQGIQVAGDFEWTKGTFHTVLAGGVDLTDIVARATVSPTNIDLKSLEAVIDLAAPGAATKSPLKFNLAGAYQVTAATGEFKLGTSAKDFAIPTKPPSFLPKEWSDRWTSYAPAGSMDLDLLTAIRIISPSDAAPATQPAVKLSDTLVVDSYYATIHPHDVALKNSSWPDAIEKLNGKIQILPDSVTMTGMSATMGNVTGKWSGDYNPASGAMSFAGDASSKGWPMDWLPYLPPAVQKSLDTKREGVSLVLHLNTLSRPGDGKPWEFDGHLNADNFAITGPLPSNAAKITFTGKGMYDPRATAASQGDSYRFTGTLAATNVMVTTHLLDTLECAIDTSALDHEIKISNITGKVAEGALQGNVLVHTAYDVATSQAATTRAPAATQMIDWSAGGYQADLVLNDADLTRLMLTPAATEEERQKIGTGRVFASLSLTETFGPHADRKGRGDLSVRDANIYNVPLSMGFMQIATFRFPIAKSFRAATMSYYLRDNEIMFERILLESPGINIAGLGTVTITDKKLDLTFVTESARELEIPVLTPVFNQFRNMQFQVTGPLDDPKMTPVPLSGIAATLRLLLPTANADSGH